MRTIVTGGSGFVGKALQLEMPWAHYISSEDVDLSETSQRVYFVEMLKDLNIDSIIHLAGRVGGIKENTEHQSKQYETNVNINMNVVLGAKEAGVKRLLACLSTCAFPDVVDHYPFDESQILDGPPSIHNFGYAMAKRQMYAHLLTSRLEDPALDYSCFSPCNLYGPGANFDENSSHFVASLVKKVYTARDGETIKLLGTGIPLRQHLYVDDLAKIIPFLLEAHHNTDPLLVVSDENRSIKEIADLAIEISNKDIKIEFTRTLDGQYRKDGSNEKLIALLGDYAFTPLVDGLRQTYKWYTNNDSRL